MDTITCKECNYVNEGQRVYCHNCGGKLDRSAIAEESRKPQKPLKRRSESSGPSAFGKFFGTFLKTTFFAFLAACLVEAVRPPDDAPAPSEVGADIVDAPSLTVDFEEAATTPRRLVYSGPALTAYLGNRLKSGKEGFIPASVLRFQQAFITLGKDQADVTNEYRVFNLPLYAGGIYSPILANGQFTLKNQGGHLGRLPVPGVIFNLVDELVFSDHIKAFAEERKGVAKMKTITVQPAAVEILSR